MRTPLFIALVVLASCSPQLTPVTERESQPLLGQTRSARVIWLLDNSASLKLLVEPNAPLCLAGCDAGNCQALCETRHDQLVAELATMSAALPGTTEQAAVFFPSDERCGAPRSIAEGLSAAEVQAMALAARPTTGGTPIAAALQYVAALPARAVETVVVLITDGVPNCNADNPNNVCANSSREALAACRCTTSTCDGINCSTGCLDDLNTVNASYALEAQGLHLLVVGLGTDLASGNNWTPISGLEMSLPRTCVTAADCSVGTCQGGVCSERLFLTTKAADFAAPALRLTEAVKRAGRCTWWLPREVAASALVVRVGGEATTAWTLAGSGSQQRVVLAGAACTQLLADESLAPQFTWIP